MINKKLIIGITGASGSVYAQLLLKKLCELQAQPDEVAMVGDRLDADVGGARPLGIYAIWIKRRAKKLTPVSILPDATVENLVDIPPLLINLPFRQ